MRRKDMERTPAVTLVLIMFFSLTILSITMEPEFAHHPLIAIAGSSSMDPAKVWNSSCDIGRVGCIQCHNQLPFGDG